MPHGLYQENPLIHITNGAEAGSSPRLWFILCRTCHPLLWLSSWLQKRHPDAGCSGNSSALILTEACCAT